MIFYLLYELGHYVAVTIPLAASYWLACSIADMHYYLSGRDRDAVISNLKVVLNGKVSDKELDEMVRGVFRNFAKYLVDFFRSSKVDGEYIKKYVSVEGMDNVKKGLSRGKGAIILSAHLGNWELGGFVMSSIYPLSAVVLTHQNKMVNDFFTRQRLLGNMKPIEIGISLRACYDTLKRNGLVALLGDRDFSNNGVNVEFFGKSAAMPKGPSLFSYRIGSCIIPTFMIRQPDDTFRLIAEEPIYPDTSKDEDTAVTQLIHRYLSVVESYIKRYPNQWYVFRKIWNNDIESLRPNTII